MTFAAQLLQLLTMNIKTTVITLLSSSILLCGSWATAKPTAAESRLAQQNELFEEQYQADLKAHPESATAYGDYRYNDQLNDYSLAGANSQHERDMRFLERLNAISTA